jgi:2,4-dienoyl-CoA reductase-like NADH-dependent reductase (Old Yellow Enzyme family)
MVATAESQRWLEALCQPLRLGGTFLPNRLMMTAMTLQYGVEGLISDRHIAFYEERARGEVGLLMSEQLVASPLSESPFGHSLRAYEARQIPRFQRLAKVLRPFGTKFFAQLWSAGAAGASTVGLSRWGALRGPSDVSAPGGETPAPLTIAEIQQLVADYARSARIVREGGLDGIEIHGAHGWLIGEFLSPLYNRRQDEYGGSVVNRCRLAAEIGAAIRREVGPAFPMGLALTYDELLGEVGITPDDALAQLRVLHDTGLFDFFDLSIGSSHQQHYTIGSMAVPHGYSLPFAATAKQLVAGGAAHLHVRQDHGCIYGGTCDRGAPGRCGWHGTRPPGRPSCAGQGPRRSNAVSYTLCGRQFLRVEGTYGSSGGMHPSASDRPGGRMGGGCSTRPATPDRGHRRGTCRTHICCGGGACGSRGSRIRAQTAGRRLPVGARNASRTQGME